MNIYSGKVYSVILAGGEGTRLFNLTKERAKPAVRFGGYSLLEIMLSLIFNSGYSNVDIITQYKHDSIEDIISNWTSIVGFDGHVRTYPPQGNSFFEGTADALRKHMSRRQKQGLYDDDTYLVLSSDHVTDLKLDDLVNSHRREESDITLAVKVMPQSDAKPDPNANSPYGIVVVDSNRNIVGFQEKPFHPAEAPSAPGYCYVNEFNMAFRPRALDSLLAFYSGNDMSFDVLTPAIRDGRFRIMAYEHPAEGYWTDAGTLDSLFSATLDLKEVKPRFNIHEQIGTGQSRFMNMSREWSGQGSKSSLGHISGSITNDGDIINGKIADSVLSYGVFVEVGSLVYRSILYDNVKVNTGAKVIDSLLDEHVYVGKGAVIDPNNLTFWIDNGEVRGKIPEGYIVSVLGKEKDHLLVQKSWNRRLHDGGSEYLSDNEMYEIRQGREIVYKNKMEFVVTPSRRLIFSRGSYIPDGFTV